MNTAKKRQKTQTKRKKKRKKNGKHDKKNGKQLESSSYNCVFNDCYDHLTRGTAKKKRGKGEKKGNLKEIQKKRKSKNERAKYKYIFQFRNEAQKQLK